jgi:Tol biopolymer transport system component
LTRYDIFLAALFWFAGHLPGSLQANALRAPEIDLSLINSEHLETGIVIAPSGREVYFTRREGRWGEPGNSMSKIFVMRYENGNWTVPQVAPFSGTHSDRDLFMTADGRAIFFTSYRPLKAGDPARQDADIWVMQRTANGWGEPRHLAEVNSPAMEWSPVTDSRGNLYFASMRGGATTQGDLYISRLKDGKYTLPVNLGAPVNSASGEWNLVLAPDDSYMIFESSGRVEGNSESGDLYVSRRDRRGNWQKPVNLQSLNTTGSDLMPRFSPDGRQLYYVSSGAAGAIYEKKKRADIKTALQP